MPLISVIVPVYKAEATLDDCVGSVLRQTLTDWEMILVDDCSPDGSGALCDRYAQQDPRITVIHQPVNQGVSVARNAGLAKAIAPCIAFLDSDDWMEPEMLDTLFNAMKTSGADSVGCAHYNVTGRGPEAPRVKEASFLPAGVYGPDELRQKIVLPLLKDRVTSIVNGFIWRFLYSADVIREAGITFSGIYLEDEVFLIDYFCNAKRLAMVEEAYINYYINPNSVTHRYVKDFPDVFRQSLQAKRERVERYGLTDLGDWEASTCWAGLLIGVSNLYAPGSGFEAGERRQLVRELLDQPEFREARQRLHPKGAGRNKQVVIDLLCKDRLFVLDRLYRVKNRGGR